MVSSNVLTYFDKRSKPFVKRCNHNNMYHNKCNTCLVFSCFKVKISFDVGIVRFVYIVIF
jgi:hypothetical protein